MQFNIKEMKFAFLVILLFFQYKKTIFWTNLNRRFLVKKKSSNIIDDPI